MKIAIHQPLFIPWMGYFDKINKSDVFVFLDHVQFTKGSWINRNRIKSQNSEILLSVPIKHKGLSMSINDTEIDNTNLKWKKKHLDTLRFAYSKTRHFNSIYPKLESIYLSEIQSLADFDIDLLLLVCEYLEFETTFIRSSTLSVFGTKTELLSNICNRLNGDTYIIGMGGNNEYMDHDTFRSHNITIESQKFDHPTYKQLGDQFIGGLSILDLLFNYGKDSIGFFKV